MSARQLHHQPVARNFPHPADPKNFLPINLRGKVLSDDSCWEEFDSEYEEPLASQIFYFIDDAD